MTDEARAFVDDLVWNDRNFMTLFTANYSFVNAELAAIYQVPAPAKEFDRVTFPQGQERAGLLGQGLFLALTSKPEDPRRRRAVSSCASSSSASMCPIRLPE